MNDSQLDALHIGYRKRRIANTKPVVVFCCNLVGLSYELALIAIDSC